MAAENNPAAASTPCVLSYPHILIEPQINNANSLPAAPASSHSAGPSARDPTPPLAPSDDDLDDSAPDPGCLAERNDNTAAEPAGGVELPSQSPSPEPLDVEQEAQEQLEDADVPLLSFEELPEPVLPDLQISMAYIRLLRQATHANSSLPDSVLQRIYAPFSQEFNLDDPDERQSVKLFLATMDASRHAYEDACAAVVDRDPHYNLLSWDVVQKRLADWTGVHLVRHDMCFISCVGFTGPYAQLDKCPNCGQARRDAAGAPRKQFFTIPLVTQLQARFASKHSARRMRYGAQKLRENLAHAAANDGQQSSFSDVFSGLQFLDAFQSGRIKERDVMVFFSTDGAQVYENKQSDCWFSIACILNLPPDIRYTKAEILPLCIIPGGAHAPKDMDSFNYPVFHEMRLLMPGGFDVWDADVGQKFRSYLHLSIASADGPGLVTLDGGVGHKGARSCRLQCPYSGRRKEGGPRYYPVLQRPNYTRPMPGSDHPDEPPENVAGYQADDQQYLRRLSVLLSAQDKPQFEAARLRTGLVKPTIFLGFPSENIMGIPGTFGIDVMHLLGINAPELLVPLWRGTFTHDPCDLEVRRGRDWPWALHLSQAALWARHGAKIRFATPYLPSWFDRPPRDPAEKINSGYKAWEYLIYLYGLGPMDLRSYLPFEYWQHFCQLVHISDICTQDEITSEALQ
jgi:hypothetical protein